MSGGWWVGASRTAFAVAHHSPPTTRHDLFSHASKRAGSGRCCEGEGITIDLTSGHPMRPHILALALAATLPAAAVAQTSATQAGAPNPAAKLPDSPTGRLGQRLLDVVADGDSARVA